MQTKKTVLILMLAMMVVALIFAGQGIVIQEQSLIISPSQSDSQLILSSLAGIGKILAGIFTVLLAMMITLILLPPKN